MPSSTFNSDRYLPQVSWFQILALSMTLLIMVIGSFEWRLASLGYHPTARDSPERWLDERSRAVKLGNRALIIVGASRIQLGLDLDVLRKETELEPVQLALDGGAAGPILEGLAKDPAISGTILVDYYDYAINARGGAAERMQQKYDKSGDRLAYFHEPSAVLENRIDRWLKERMRVYADGANPISSFGQRIVPGNAARQYLVTLPDRSRKADYSLVNMPEFYYQRVARTLGAGSGPVPDATEQALKQKISEISAVDNASFIRDTRAVSQWVSAIQSRGGRVIFVAMPSAGMVREIEARRFPREYFWDRFVSETGVLGIHSAHEPTLDGYSPPDGSHLDMRDRAGFTLELSRLISSRNSRAQEMHQLP